MLVLLLKGQRPPDGVVAFIFYVYFSLIINRKTYGGFPSVCYKWHPYSKVFVVQIIFFVNNFAQQGLLTQINRTPALTIIILKIIY